jgi:two-component system, NarL family, response regulator DegU
VEPNHKLRIVIADDHPVFRYGLRQIIEAEPAFDVVGEAGDGKSALHLIQTLDPAIAILDVGMPELDGLAVAHQLLAASATVKIIFVTMYREEDLFKQAVEAGVRGYVLKDSAVIDIVSCIKAVAAGQNFVSPELTTFLMSMARPTTPRNTSPSGLENLTTTELRVLSLIADYKTSKEIAQELGVGVRTVDSHRNNLCQKLGVHGSHALMKFALEHKRLLPGLNST